MTTLPARIRSALEAVADPARAPGMQAYMKSDMPYLGVSAVPLRATCKSAFADLSYGTREAWESDVLALWRGAAFREERYAALELAAFRAAKPFHTVAALPMYEEMVVTGAWWDTVDIIATQRFWVILEQDRAAMKAAMLAWSTDADMWKRRCAILCQNPAKAKTDLPFLHACIAPSLDSKQFFLRKAIGWALRQYARTDPAEIARYVAAQGDRMSPLSRREALKHVKLPC